MKNKFANWIINKFKKKAPKPPKPPTPTESKELGQPDMVVLLWAPAYDKLTRFVSSWFEDIEIPATVTTYKSIGEDINSKEFLEALKATEGRKSVKIFGGHGIPNALLGPPDSNFPQVNLGRGDHSILYTADMTLSRLSCLYAFACEAGQLLGKAFCSSEERSFLGYNDKIFLEVANQECIASWRNVFKTIASEIIRTGEILPEHERMLENLYHREYLYYQNGVGQTNNRRALMLMYLDNHRDSIVRYPSV